MSFACAAHMVQDEVHAPGKGRRKTFFAGRRTPHPEFHLLQHLYLRELWGDATFTTSSLAAARVLDGSRPLIGTWAHEGVMAFQAMFSGDARRARARLVGLWTALFWARDGQPHDPARRDAARRRTSTRSPTSACSKDVGWRGRTRGRSRTLSTCGARASRGWRRRSRTLATRQGAGARVQVLRRRRLLRREAARAQGVFAGGEDHQGALDRSRRSLSSTAEFGTLRPGWAGQARRLPTGGVLWAAFDAGDAAAMQKARAKFIVALDAPDREHPRAAAGTGRARARTPRTPPAAAITAAQRRRGARRRAPDRQRAGDGALRRDQADLTGFAGRVRAAAPALPDAP